MSSDAEHAALRASVRQLTTLLGEALTRHEGAELLELVETVRASPASPTTRELREMLDGLDPGTAVVLARAFTAYFQLVNTTEQLHRWQEVAATARARWPRRSAASTTALDDGSLDRDLLTSVLGRLEYRPVFTAHPTEASRRSVLRLLRKVAETVRDAWRTPRLPAAQRPADERRLAELVDLVWQTDELRVVRPEPSDEARTAVYYLRSIAVRGRPRPARGARPPAGPDRRRAARDRPAAAFWHVGRRRPRRQPQRDPRRHPRDPAPAAHVRRLPS